METEETQGTADEATEAGSEQDTAQADSSATQPQEGQGQATFLDDDAWMERIRQDPNLDKAFRQMQSAYTKKLEKVKGVEQAADLVNRFNSDPEFAKQTILQRAQQLGLHVGMAGQPAQPSQPAAGQAPQSMVDRIKSSLDPSLQWLAPQLANAFYPAVQEAVQPLQQQLGQSKQTLAEQQFDELSSKLPAGWEAHEDDMTALLDFLKSDRMTDKRFGSKLDLLYKTVRGGDYAATEALTRMANAAKNRTTTGQAGRQTTDNLKDRLLKTSRSSSGPRGFNEAFKIAAQAAEEEMRRQGATVPE